jgi:aryl-alcohol dehydrogenase-like predicted oxidoreductase
MDELTRRSFLAAAPAALVVPARAWAEEVAGQASAAAGLPMVALGRTGRTVPRLGFGSAPVGRMKVEAGAVEVINAVIRAGIRYLDTAPSYSSGRAEQRIGVALGACGVNRGAFFIATKTLRRDGDGARRELEESMKRLGVDYVDSIQVHEIHDDLDTAFGAGAVVEALEKAKDEGLVRHIGVTCHRDPAYIVEAVRRHPFATALVPVNPLDVKHLSFVQDFLPVAADRGTAVIAMKVFAGGHLLADGRFTAAELLRYALSTPHVDVVVPGCDAVAHVDAASAALRGFEAMSAEQRSALEARAGEHRGKKSEWYKNPR